MYHERLGGLNRFRQSQASILRKRLEERARRINVKETVAVLNQIVDKGFVYTNNLVSFSEVIGFLKDNGIPYEYIDGGEHWKYAIRRIDQNTD